MLAQLLPYIEQELPFPFELTLQALNFIHGGPLNEQQREAANAIKSGAGDLLPWNALRLFIRAEISDSECQKLMSARRAYIERASRVLPSILKRIGVFDTNKIHSILMRLDDCCHDYPLIAVSKSSKLKKKEIVENIRNAQLAASELINLCDHIEFAHEYNKHITTGNKNKKYGSDIACDFDDLIYCIKVFRFIGKVVLANDEAGYADLGVGSNKAVTHIVESVYETTSIYGDVKFVTTPGSDFSFLCGLVLEMACGVKDQGLAGAIGKFSRSSERKIINQNVSELNYENSSEYVMQIESDNFNSIKYDIELQKIERKKWEHHLLNGTYDKFEYVEIVMRINSCDKQIEELNEVYGPKLVWASQMPSECLDELLESQAAILALEIKLGALRRRHGAVDLKSR